MQGAAEIAHGPMFIGLLVNVLLYGIMITQVYLYFSSYKKDKTWIKLFVLLLLLCDTVNSVFDSVYLYGSLILHFNEVEYLGKANWVFATDPVMTAIIAILVQGFFAWRIQVLTGNKWFVGTVVATSLAGFRMCPPCPSRQSQAQSNTQSAELLHLLRLAALQNL
ncbi:hypothetical protein PM082_017302 [Marasmius tenuissimus]|nr:hypothetical protein PM082_017302 [Marasmius tenuissimus]